MSSASSESTSPESASTVSVVLFDLDDTLFDHHRAVALGVTAKCRSYGGPLASVDGTEAMKVWHRLEEQHYVRYLSGELTLQGQRRVRVQEFVRSYGVELSDEDALDWYNDYLTHYDKSWLLHDDTVPALDDLERVFPGVRFGIITNAELSYQTPKLDLLELSPRMHHVIGSGEFGFPKPDARIFEHACELFEVHPSQAVYVGDRLHTDARGAHDAGLTGIWIDRGIVTPSDEELKEATAAGVLTVSSLLELPALLLAS